MVRKKMTTYVEEDLLRAAKTLAAQSDSKIYEVFEEALKLYLAEAGEEVTEKKSLSEAIPEGRGH